VQSARFRLPSTPASSELVAKHFPALAAGEVTRQLGQPQPMVSHHLACLRWCGFVTTRRQRRVVHYQPADPRVAAMLGLAHGLLDDHAAACCRIREA